MATTPKARPQKSDAPPPPARRGGKKSKTYRLSEEKIARAQRILGVATATAAIETALDMVVFRQELIDGTVALLGVAIAKLDAPGDAE